MVGQLNMFVICSGGGMVDSGFGNRVQAAIDNNSWALEAYRLNNPGDARRVQADILKQTATEVIAKVGAKNCDLLWASTPCQPWSCANGKPSRHYNKLMQTLLAPPKYAALLNPKFVVCENVCGLADREPGKNWLKWLREDLILAGYPVQAIWRLNAINFGGCQKRERFFLVAARKGLLPLQPEGSFSRERPAMTLRDAIGNLSEENAMADGCQSMSEHWRQIINKIKPGQPLFPKTGYQRLSYDRTCETLRTSPSIKRCPILVHPTKNRFLSVREYACIMGRPDYVFPSSMPLMKRYSIVGQGIPGFLGKAVIEQLEAGNRTERSVESLPPAITQIKEPSVPKLSSSLISERTLASEIQCAPIKETLQQKLNKEVAAAAIKSSRVEQIIQGDALAVLKSLPDQSVNCVVTSPPYWMLRDYGVSGQLGREATVEEYIENMVAVFAEVKRVLRSDGTCWLNIGDKIKPKGLCLIPQRLAIALQADGWNVRSDNIWRKPSIFPQSVPNYPLREHEYVFILSKEEKYYYDISAMREITGREMTWEQYNDNKISYAAHAAIDNARVQKAMGKRRFKLPSLNRREANPGTGRALPKFSKNGVHPDGKAIRSVWTISSDRSGLKHYAMFPEALARRCILAGCPPGGIVLDPFSGAGTVATVAAQNGRNYIGIELNPNYCEMARKRIEADRTGENRKTA